MNYKQKLEELWRSVKEDKLPKDMTGKDISKSNDQKLFGMRNW